MPPTWRRLESPRIFRRPILERMEPLKQENAVVRRSANGLPGWSLTKNENTARSGCVLSRLQVRLDDRRRPLRTGWLRLRLSWVAATLCRNLSKIAQRFWTARTKSCAEPKRFCAKRLHILPRRSSTAVRSDGVVCRRISRRLGCRADLSRYPNRTLSVL